MNTLERQLYWSEYIAPLFEKYKEVPTILKYIFIERDYRDMFGKSMANDKMKYLYDDSETFIRDFDNSLSLSKTVKKNLLKKAWEEIAYWEYIKLVQSGMFWEFFPNLKGNWFEDKEYFTNFVAEREMKKEYINLIL